MSSESDLVDKLAQSIADGDSIDWEAIDKLPADDELRRLVQLFRVVANVGEVHRSPADDSSPKPDQITTKPRSDHLSPGAPTPSSSGAGLGQWGHLLLLRKIGEGAFGEVFQGARQGRRGTGSVSLRGGSCRKFIISDTSIFRHCRTLAST
jgi:hypothetical protein